MWDAPNPERPLEPIEEGREYPEPPTDEQLLAECRIETFRAGGPGGQHQNKTDSAVRLTHEPSGIVVTARESRSQRRNRLQALERLRVALEERSKPKKRRVPTRATGAARRKRLENKRRRAAQKRSRRKPGPDD